MVHLFHAPSLAYQVCSFLQGSLVTTAMKPPSSAVFHALSAPSPLWHAPNTLNMEILSSLLVLLKLTIWGLEGCQFKPPLLDVYH